MSTLNPADLNNSSISFPDDSYVSMFNRCNTFLRTLLAIPETLFLGKKSLVVITPSFERTLAHSFITTFLPSFEKIEERNLFQ